MKLKLEFDDSTAKELLTLLRDIRPVLATKHQDLIESYEYAYLDAARDAEENQHGGKIVVAKKARRIDQLIAFMRSKGMSFPRTNGMLVSPKNRQKFIDELEAEIADAGYVVPTPPEE